MAVITCHDYNVLIDEHPSILATFIEQLKPSKIFVIVDNNTKLHCLPIFESYFKFPFLSVQIAEGEKFKNLKTCTQIWEVLIQNGCDRASLIINLGGGVIGDMGGFIASTYMRGISFIQIPTTLLSQVDASIGGKLGIDFLTYKNMIGLFNNPKLVWIESKFLKTLPERELKSGFAEVAKHALIKDADLWKIVKTQKLNLTEEEWLYIIERCVLIKKQVVSEDPYENNIRKILNFGHSIGHAIESIHLDKPEPLRHGEAIAIGMVCDAYISYREGLLAGPELKEIRQFIDEVYKLKISLWPLKEEIIEKLAKDKKNKNGQLLFPLLKSIGVCIYDQNISNLLIEQSLRFWDERPIQLAGMATTKSP